MARLRFANRLRVCCGSSRRSTAFHRTANSVLTICFRRGGKRILLRFLDHAVTQEFVKPANLRLVQVARDSEEALHWIGQQQGKAWINQHAGTQNADELKA